MLLHIGNDLHLSSLRMTDIDAYLKHLNDGGEISARTPVIPYPYTEEAANWWIKHRIEFTELAGREISFAIRNAEGMLIGSVGADDFRIGESHRAEVGFWVARAYRNRGIATNALGVFVRYAFEQLDLDRLTAHTLVFNTASARVLEKNGFQVEGCLRKHTRINGTLFDTLAYGLLKEDWSRLQMTEEEEPMAKATQWRGDNGATPLNPPEIYVPKDSPVILALGALQELSASLGLARSLLDADLVELQDMLRETQRHLYILKCDLASISDEEFVNGKKIPRPNGNELQIVDQHIGKLEGYLGSKPDRFILEGGAAAATALFLANEVTRRAERLFISLQNLTDLPAGLHSKTVSCQQYLNHLSYQLYLMARVTNRSLGVPEESISTDPATGEVVVTTDTQ